MIASSELIINPDGSIFHLHIKPEELADTVILVGDPGRVEMVASFFETREAEAESREFRFVTGTYRDKRITALSTGIGCDNIDIVVNELDALANIDFQTREIKKEHRRLNLLRIGTCGAIQPDIPLGSFVFSEISVGCDGLLNWYEDRDQIAEKDFEAPFMEHCAWAPYLPVPYFVRAADSLIERFRDKTIFGVTISASGFYGPQGRVLRQGLAMPNMIADFESFRHNGYRITNFEMEGSALAGLAHHLGHDAATVCCVIANRHLGESNTDYKPRVRELIQLSLDCLTA
ncbi:MAG: nucleoside phosphorylase [Bacteroidales bacterium]|nr:nucleoside phosphorylase [Bacteroidales bacterium]